MRRLRNGKEIKRKGEKMGKVKNFIYDWLENYGFSLGYDMHNAPEIEDLNWVANDNVDAQTYWENKNK